MKKFFLFPIFLSLILFGISLAFSANASTLFCETGFSGVGCNDPNKPYYCDGGCKKMTDEGFCAGGLYNSAPTAPCTALDACGSCTACAAGYSQTPCGTYPRTPTEACVLADSGSNPIANCLTYVADCNIANTCQTCASATFTNCDDGTRCQANRTTNLDPNCSQYDQCVSGQPCKTCSTNYALCGAGANSGICVSNPAADHCGTLADTNCTTGKCATCVNSSYALCSNSGSANYQKCLLKITNCSSGTTYDPCTNKCEGSITPLKLSYDSLQPSGALFNSALSVPAITALSSGEVGLGITNPESLLHLFHATSGPKISLSGIDGTVGNNNYRGISIQDTSNTEKFFTGLNNSNNFVLRHSDAYDLFSASSTEARIGVGSNFPPQRNYELAINGKLSLQGALAELSIPILNTSGTDKIMMINTSGVLYATSSSIATGLPTGTVGQTLYANASNAWTASSFLYNSGSYIGIGTTTAAGSLHVIGDVTVKGNLVFSGDAAYDIRNVKKLTVTTIDPLYNIFGVNYSSYAASFVGGVKEEVSGKINIENKIGKEYQAVIDFDKQVLGSDLWVWRKVIDFSKNNLEVFITPYGKFADTYYYVSGNRLIFRSSVPVEASYRLIAKRFDWRTWPTLAEDQTEKASLIIK